VFTTLVVLMKENHDWKADSEGGFERREVHVSSREKFGLWSSFQREARAHTHTHTHTHTHRAEISHELTTLFDGRKNG